MAFEAKYHGRCEACDESIIPGEEVRYSEDDELVHNRCEDANISHAAAVEICGQCWLTRPCDCEEAP